MFGNQEARNVPSGSSISKLSILTGPPCHGKATRRLQRGGKQTNLPQQASTTTFETARFLNMATALLKGSGHFSGIPRRQRHHDGFRRHP